MGSGSSRKVGRQADDKHHFVNLGISLLSTIAPHWKHAFPTNRLIAIGDIHGCIHALEALLEAIKPTPSDQVVVLGDFIDGGRDSNLVVERLRAMEQECRL